MKCGGEQLVDGALYSPMRMSFRPAHSTFLTLETGDIMTKATICRECGHVEITGDARKLNRLVARPPADPAKP